MAVRLPTINEIARKLEVPPEKIDAILRRRPDIHAPAVADHVLVFDREAFDAIAAEIDRERAVEA